MKKGLFIIGLLVAFLGNAQISSISNGESGSSVRTKLNAVIDSINNLANIYDITQLSKTNGNIIVGDGSNWVTESGNTARTSLGLGTGDSPQFFNLNLQNNITMTSGLSEINASGNIELDAGVSSRVIIDADYLDMGSSQIKFLATPTDGTDGATKAYTDDLVDDLSGVSDASAARDNLSLGSSDNVTFQSLDLGIGGDLSIGSGDYGANGITKGTLDFDIEVTSGYLGITADSVYLNDVKITNVADPVNAKDVANRQWVLSQVGAGGGLSGSGVPVNNQVGVWLDANTLEGDANFTWDGDALNVDDININGEAITSTSGDIALGNFDFDANQTIGASQDDYVLTYDDASGKISLEFATGGVTLGTNGQIPFMNVGGTDFIYTDDFKYNNTASDVTIELWEQLRFGKITANGNIYISNLADTTSTILQGGGSGGQLYLSGLADGGGVILSASGSSAIADVTIRSGYNPVNHVRIDGKGGVDLEVNNFNELEVSSGLVEVQNDFGVLGESDLGTTTFAGSVNLTDETNYINNTRVSHSFGASNPDDYTIISSSNLSSVGEVMILFVTAGTLTGSHYYTCQVLVSNSGSIVNIEPVMDSAGILSIVDDGSGNLVARKTGTGTPNVRISYLRIL